MIRRIDKEVKEEVIRTNAVSDAGKALLRIFGFAYVTRLI